MIKVFEMFSGYGGASFSLKKVGIDYECIGISEIDKYAIQCFNNNFPNIKNYGDCTKINPNDLPDFDLLTGGFPCQAFSVAGKGLGELDTRGTLFNEIIRIAEVKKPKYMILENVKGLTTKKHKDTFNKILSELKRIGYDVIWKVLNTKDYGIPQNRERVFFICKLGKWEFNEFQFPEKEELKITIKDILEEEVDKKYYLSELMQERFRKYLIEKESKIMAMRGRNPDNPKSRKVGLPTIQMLEKRDNGCSNSLTSVQKDNLVFSVQMGNVNRGKIPYNPNDREVGFCLNKEDGVSYTPMISNSSPREVGFKEISPAILSRDYKDPKIIKLGNIYEKEGEMGNIYSKEGISPAITGYHKGDSIKVSGTITQAFGRSGCLKEELRSAELNLNVSGSLRRLTPRECFRLMGFLNDEINLDGLSDTQRYKLAGNGWDVNLISKLFKEMFKNGK